MKVQTVLETVDNIELALAGFQLFVETLPEDEEANLTDQQKVELGSLLMEMQSAIDD